ncbi:hypothetical protein PUN28_016741 [Cardiocondyla obscurior]|uniref:Gamma-tubulin complex component n=1 Tax=Cardiocondyla obscurior TaxID=286306 RepID=A0AAW2EQM6_9HYME
MLHEILLSLWGCSTSVSQIIETNSVDLDKYLHPGERALLNKIMDIVKKCNVVRNFIQTVSNEDAKEYVASGLYIRALCDGMDQALEPFREEIIDLENIVLNNRHTPLSLILCSVEKYTCLFSVLHSIIREIHTQKLHGCKLLQCLHQRMHTGVPEINSTLELMAHSVHIVFYKHLTSWLLYGHLEDTHREFFIQKTSDCEKTLTFEDGKNDIDTRETTSNNIIINMWDYNIQIDMLPSYIRPSLASKILTIGQTIIMFGNDPRQKKDFSMSSKTENSVWGDKEYEYFRKLQNLQEKSVFNIVEFDRTINELKQCVTELLWHVAVEEAQLMQQLKLVKEFFLMGRGDFYLEFIKLTAHILNKAPMIHTSRDINLAFQMALRKMHLNDESAIDSFNFVVPMLPSENEDVDTDATDLADNEKQDPNEKRGWGMITLKYKVVWPLHLFFNPTALNDYNTLFRFLLRVKKTQIDLWNLWSEHMHHKNIDIGVIQLRNNLIFIIDNLQYYLQVDVVESQYTVMETSMKNTQNFEDIQKAHSIFLANVMSQTFLLDSGTGKKNSVNKLIHILLRLCDDFILQASMWEVGNLLLTEKEELKTLCETLNSVMDWLTKTLHRVRAQPSGEHLARLLLRLDFNRWFSKKI